MTAEELLMSEESETFEYSNVITIDRESRAINVPLGQEMFGVEGDKGASIKHFSCPKIVGDNIDIDLSAHNLYVNYVAADNEGNQKSEDVQQAPCENIEVEGENITFDWKISEWVTQEDGFIAFSIVAKKSVDGILQTRWYTTPAVGHVLKTIKEGANITQKYPDVIDNLMNRVKELERVIESGGGDSQIDPRRIPDMYYKESIKGTEILPETTYEIESGNSILIEPVINLIPGNKYIVKFNGVEYQCTAEEVTVDGMTGICIGYNPNNESYPFAFMNVPDMFDYATMFGVRDGSTSVTVSIAQEIEDIHTIPEEYLGLDWLPKMAVNETVLFEEQTVIVDELVGVIGNYKSYDLGLDKETRTKMVEEYESLTVVVDGTVIELPYVKKFGTAAYFTRIPYDSMSEVHFGMVEVGSGKNNTANVALDIGEHVLKVNHITKSINQMPVEYLPDGVPYLVDEMAEIIPETEATFTIDNDYMYPYTTDYVFKAGESYVVTWNGVNYTCVGQEIALDSVATGIVVGNGELFGASGNNEPFAVVYAPDSTGGVASGMVAHVDLLLNGGDPETTKFSVSGGSKQIRKLPEECLPESVDSVIIRSSTEGSTKKFKLTVDDSGTISATEIVE